MLPFLLIYLRPIQSIIKFFWNASDLLDWMKCRVIGLEIISAVEPKLLWLMAISPALWEEWEENCTAFYLFTKHFLVNFLGIAHVFLTIDYFHTTSQEHLVLENHHVCTEIGKLALKYYAPHKWNNLQKFVKLNKLIPFNEFKSLLTDIEQCECKCFLWIDVVLYIVVLVLYYPNNLV